MLGFLNSCWKAHAHPLYQLREPPTSGHTVCSCFQGRVCSVGARGLAKLEALFCWSGVHCASRCPWRGVRPECWVAGDPSGPRPLRKAHRPFSGRAVHTQVHVKPRFGAWQGSSLRPKMSQWKKKKKKAELTVSGGEINSEI